MNTTTATPTIESLQEEKKQLISQLIGNRATPEGDKILESIRAIEVKIKAMQRKQLLTNVNREQAQKRELAALVYSAEQPLADITNADGTFHATKVKKYPILAQLAANHYGRATWRDERLTTIKAGREEFTMYHAKSEYNQPTQYTRPETFEDFLSLNGIAAQDITEQQYNELTEAAEANNKKLEEAIEAHSREQKRLNLYFYSTLGLFEQSRAGHVYKFEASK
jgi:hypothetical protein